MNRPLNNILFQQGELGRRIPKYKFRWPELVFLAAAEHEPFADVRIVTLYSHCEDLAMQKLIDECQPNHPIFITPDSPRTKSWVSQNLPGKLSAITVREYIEIFNSEVVVGVDADIIDDAAVDRALEMLETVEEFTVGTYFQFGSLKQYAYKEVDEACKMM